jgi:hypothetical protein
MCGGCERKSGRITDASRKNVGTFEFLSINRNIDWYGDEFAQSTWCRSPATIKSRPNNPKSTDSRMPPIFAQESGWMWFGGSGGEKGDGSEKAFSSLIVVNELVAYKVRGTLMVTFDGCVTRHIFGDSEFDLTMRNMGLRVSTRGGGEKNTSLFDLSVHEGGGCFLINPKSTKNNETLYYCTSDNTKSWSVETTRDPKLHKGPIKYTEEEIKHIRYMRQGVNCKGSLAPRAREDCPEQDR